MPMTITLPELGEGVDSVDVVTVLVAIGDHVEIDQSLIEVETEKASVEVPSTAAGTVKEVHVKEGDTVGEKAPIVTLDVADESVAEEAEGPESQPEPAAEREQGSTGERERGSEGEREKGSGEALPAVASQTSSLAPQSVPGTGGTIIPAAPTVRRFAREIGVDLRSVKGSGQGGRISIDDVKEHNRRLLASSDGGSVAAATAELPDLGRFGPIHREPMTKVRRLTAANLTRAWLTAPQVTNHEVADITDLEEFRKAFKGRVEEAGGKLSMTAILVKIVASNLKQHPTLNAAVDMVHHEIVFRDSVNIGVAVDTERGLLVPVIPDADRIPGSMRSRGSGPESLHGSARWARC